MHNLPEEVRGTLSHQAFGHSEDELWKAERDAETLFGDTAPLTNGTAWDFTTAGEGQSWAPPTREFPTLGHLHASQWPRRCHVTSNKRVSCAHHFPWTRGISKSSMQSCIKEELRCSEMGNKESRSNGRHKLPKRRREIVLRLLRGEAT